jgi:hypothetical protein
MVLLQNYGKYCDAASLCHEEIRLRLSAVLQFRTDDAAYISHIFSCLHIAAIFLAQ